MALVLFPVTFLFRKSLGDGTGQARMYECGGAGRSARTPRRFDGYDDDRDWLRTPGCFFPMQRRRASSLRKAHRTS